MISLRSSSLMACSMMGFAIRILRSNLVERDGNPPADCQIGKPSAHGRIARDNSVKGRWIALRKNHAFAAAGGASGEIRERLPAFRSIAR